MFDSFTCPCYTICKERRYPLTVSLCDCKKATYRWLEPWRLLFCFLSFRNSSVFFRRGGMDFIISITSFNCRKRVWVHHTLERLTASLHFLLPADTDHLWYADLSGSFGCTVCGNAWRYYSILIFIYQYIYIAIFISSALMQGRGPALII